MSSLEAKLGLFLTFLTVNGGGNVRGMGMEVEKYEGACGGKERGRRERRGEILRYQGAYFR